MLILTVNKLKSGNVQEKPLGKLESQFQDFKLQSEIVWILALQLAKRL
jgi:hypothetical protein